MKRRTLVAAAGILAIAGSIPLSALAAEKTIVVGVTAGPHAEIMEVVKRIAEKQGMKIRIVEFNDFVQPNAALVAGDLDINSFQHKPYMDQQNEDRGYKLASAAPTIISGPPTLVKQDVKVSSPKAMRERECSLAVAEGRTNLSELARLNSENEARLERGKTTAKSLPDPHPFPRSCGVRSSRFSSCERPIHQSLRAVGVHLLNSMPTMNYRKPSVPDNA